MKSNFFGVLSLIAIVVALNASPVVAGKPVGISKSDGPYSHEMGTAVRAGSHRFMRNQDNKNTVNPAFAKTSRPCPPFCIQPMNLRPGIETIGEQEIIHYAVMASKGQRMPDGSEIMIIDSRTPDWVAKGTIPGAINIPWTHLSEAKGADPISIAEIMTDKFGAKEQNGLFYYDHAKTLVMFCNGMWCGQSPNNIKSLLKYGYPAHKIKWYRGGMQNWEILGFNTVK
ncbi:MAG: sulfurtransferase [Gammaproteobacteria bacterium]|nr:sulfurtransferase [Gammaproteobacteria bacterium]|tara:strand:+ start:1301 stop:1981 length:681 start_codon:yes stop_codon:yes gene_type:complete